MTRQKVRMRNDMEFPPIDEFAYEVAEKALDEITYDGKTIREWIDILAKQQPCEDAISREAVLKHLDYITMDTNPDHYEDKDKWYQANGFNLCKVDLELYIENLPPVTPKLSTGKWIAMGEGFTPYECSECEAVEFKKSKYCPNCGAKMEVEE